MKKKYEKWEDASELLGNSAPPKNAAAQLWAPNLKIIVFQVICGNCHRGDAAKVAGPERRGPGDKPEIATYR